MPNPLALAVCVHVSSTCVWCHAGRGRFCPETSSEHPHCSPGEVPLAGHPDALSSSDNTEAKRHGRYLYLLTDAHKPELWDSPVCLSGETHVCVSEVRLTCLCCWCETLSLSRCRCSSSSFLSNLWLCVSHSNAAPLITTNTHRLTLRAWRATESQHSYRQTGRQIGRDRLQVCR